MQKAKTPGCVRLALAAVLFSIGLSPAQAAHPFPRKPIKVLVYTKPGGAIDVFARKFKSVAKKYTKANFVIVNRPGAGGIIALKQLLRSKKDGYTIAAVTKSNIGKMVSAGSDLNVDQFAWLGALVMDPEAIIVNRNSGLSDWPAVVNAATQNPGKQLWLGPAVGGNDHIMALKTWEKTGIKAKWIPYAGGGKAIAALLGKHGDVYVGNPGDVMGKPSLKIVAISSQSRLSGEFSDIPTFAELGVANHDQEFMWRGFVGPAKMPEKTKAYYEKLFKDVHADPQWQDFIKERGAVPVLYDEDGFTKLAKQDHGEFHRVLKELGTL